MQRPPPGLSLALLASLCVGAATVGAPLLDPTALVPRTRFTEGQFINLALGAHELPWPLHTGLLGWPTGASFAPLLWPALPLAAMTGPVLALNLVFLLLPVVNAAGGWLAARWLGLGDWAGAALGGLCAWSAWTLNTTGNGQLEQVPVAGAALIWAALWRSVDTPLPSARLAPGLLTLAVGLAAPHVGLAALVGVGVIGLLRAREWRRLLLPLVGIAVATLIVHGYHSPQFGEGVSVYAPKGAVTTEEVGPELPGVFEVATLRRLFLPPDLPNARAQGVAHCAYLGWVPLLAAGWAARGRASRAWLVVAAVLAVAALGESVELFGVQVPLPAAIYGKLSVALSRSANPYRLVLGAVVALGIAAAHAVRGPRSALALVAAAWVEVVVTRTRSIPLPNEPWGAEPAARALAGGVGPVLDLPVPSPRCPDLGWHYATQAMFHGRPVPLTLRFDWRAWGTIEPLAHQLVGALASPTCAEALPGLVARGGFTSIVVHSDVPCPDDPRTRTCLEAAYGPPQQEGATTWWTSLGPPP